MDKNNSEFAKLVKAAGPARLAVVQLANKGWKFESAYWECHHNGTPYYDVRFKSPRMKEFCDISERDWPTINEKKLLELEARKLTYAWIENLNEELPSELTKPLYEILDTTDFSVDSAAPKMNYKTKVLTKNISKIKKVTLTLTIE